MDKEEKLLCAEDVARILGTSSEVVVSLSRKGRLRGRKMGKYWRYHHKDVKLYIQEKKKPR